MERIDTEALLSSIDIAEIIGKYISLKREGDEYKATCPFHDENSASFTIFYKNPNDRSSGIYKCFGCGVSGDAIDFVMRTGVPFRQACEVVNGGPIVQTEIVKRTKLVRSDRTQVARWQPVMPDDEAPTFAHYKHRTHVKAWPWHDKSGQVTHYTVRFDKAEGGKDVLPYTYCECVDEGYEYVKKDGTGGGKLRKVGEREWRWMAPSLPRAIYNLHLVEKYPDATILLVEGEKTADAVMANVDPSRTVAVTWMGGANGIARTDFSPLNGRKVIMWPDNDWSHSYGDSHPNAGERKPLAEQPGNKAMLGIGDIIKPKVLKWVRLYRPEEFPCGWDAADKDWAPDELRQFVLSNLSDPLEKQQPTPEQAPVQKPAEVTPPAAAPAPSPAPPMNVVANNEGPFENEHFRFLGYEKEESGKLKYHFFSFAAKAVISLTPSSINKANLMMLAPINWWEEMHPGGRSSRVDIDSAQQFLIGLSHERGTFNENYVRGRGAWLDDGKIIVHTGNVLIVDNAPVPLKDFRSRYVYEVGERLGYGTSTPLRTIHSAELIRLAKWLLFEQEITPYLLLGWCVISPFCGVLQWRPHIWLTGPAGSGKSWTMDHMVKRLIGETAIVVQGRTSEAGVRGLLQRDARPVLFDETDVDNNSDKERIQNIVALARSASYHDGGVISKGTQSGSSRTYTMRSCFAFSSIGVQLNQQSDRSRFTMLSLMSFEGKRTKEDFAAFEKEWNDMVNTDFVKALQSRTLSLLPVIIKNARTFADAVTHVIGQRRTGDQVGGMLAGAYSLTSGKEISYEDAVAWVKARDWSEERALEHTKDEYRLFGKLMGHITPVEGDYSKLDRSVGELAEMVYKGVYKDTVSPYRAHERLRRLGFMIKDGYILIANQAEGVTAIIRDTPWASNHNKVLERIRNSRKFDPLQFAPGIKSRSVGIPISMLTDETVQQHINFEESEFSTHTGAEPF